MAMLEQNIKALKVTQGECDAQLENSDAKPSLSRSCLPLMVPNFTGRQRECDEIVRLVTSESTQIVSIWGSPGFGKTSVAIAVGHDLHSQGLPVYFLSLRGLRSKADLILKLLTFVREVVTDDQPLLQYLDLSYYEELCQVFSKISNRFLLILDDADDLLTSGFENVTEEVIELFEEILKQNKSMTFAVTTRRCFMNSHFQGHQAIRVGPLDEVCSRSLVHELLPIASTSDGERIAQICGRVPLTVRLLCSSISEDNPQPNHFLDDFMKSSTEGITKMLDNPDDPTNHRFKFIFDSSFQRLPSPEKEALVSLCILPETFNVEVAAAVLGKTRLIEAKKILQSLQRKAFLEPSSRSASFSMHKLLQSFAIEKGAHQLKEIFMDSKARFYTFYISLFKKLNEQFLAGHSMTAFIAFYENKQNIIQSLIEGCSLSKTADSVFDVLVNAELFQDSLFWISDESSCFEKIYHSALKAAEVLGTIVSYRRLLASRAFSEVTWGIEGDTMRLLSEVNEIQTTSCPVSSDEKGKHLCYLGIYQLATGDTESGVQCLQQAVPLMDNSPEQTILRVVIFQILVVYYQVHNDSSNATYFYSKAFQECSAAGDTQLLVIPPIESTTTEIDENPLPQRRTETLLNQPLKLQVAFHVMEATKHFFHTDTNISLTKCLLKILTEVETPLPNGPPGLFNFHRVVVSMLSHFEDTVTLSETHITDNPAALEHYKNSNGNSTPHFESVHKGSLAKSYLDIGEVQYNKGNLAEALHSFQRAVDTTLKLFGEGHPITADSYCSLGATQHALGDFTSALHSKQRELSIRQSLSGDEPDSNTADCLYSLGSTQLALGDFTSALQLTQRALHNRIKLFGEEYPSTADSFYALGITQYALSDFTSALQSTQRALHSRIKLFGEEHPSTADSYNSLGAIQHALGELTLALQSKRRAIEIRLKLFGEEHASTADSYNSLGVTQHSLSDFTTALQSKQRAMEIRLKLFGEEHWSTAESYYSLGGTQYKLGEYTLALHSKQRSLNIRQKLFGEDHSSTAYSYYSLGATQHALGDFPSALHSKQRAVDIRLKLFGEDHLGTADSFYSLGVTQHELGDFASVLQSYKRAIKIRLKLFGKELANKSE